MTPAWTDPPNHDPDHCLRCDLRRTISRGVSDLRLPPEQIFRALVATVAEFIAHDEQGADAHREMAEAFGTWLIVSELEHARAILAEQRAKPKS
jgi:hypothetical protein